MEVFQNRMRRNLSLRKRAGRGDRRDAGQQSRLDAGAGGVLSVSLWRRLEQRRCCVCVCVLVGLRGAAQQEDRWAWRSRRKSGRVPEFSTGSLVPSPHPGELQALDSADSWVYFHLSVGRAPDLGVHLRATPLASGPCSLRYTSWRQLLPRTSECH